MDRAHYLGEPVIGRFFRSLILPTVLIVVLLAGLFTAMDYYAAIEQPRAASDPSSEPVGRPPKAEVTTARPIDPRLFGQPFTVDPGSLTRVPPREPMRPTAVMPEEPEKPLLHRPIALSAGTLSFNGRNLVLSGIVPTQADRFCEGPDGEDWPCGMVARTAFRNFLHSRALDCDVGSEQWEGTATTSCRMGETDLAAWLVRNGWAEAEPGSDYAELGDEARSENRGLFGSDPR